MRGSQRLCAWRAMRAHCVCVARAVAAATTVAPALAVTTVTHTNPHRARVLCAPYCDLIDAHCVHSFALGIVAKIAISDEQNTAAGAYVRAATPVATAVAAVAPWGPPLRRRAAHRRHHVHSQCAVVDCYLTDVHYAIYMQCTVSRSLITHDVTRCRCACACVVCVRFSVCGVCGALGGADDVGDFAQTRHQRRPAQMGLVPRRYANVAATATSAVGVGRAISSTLRHNPAPLTNRPSSAQQALSPTPIHSPTHSRTHHVSHRCASFAGGVHCEPAQRLSGRASEGSLRDEADSVSVRCGRLRALSPPAHHRLIVVIVFFCIVVICRRRICLALN